MTLRKTNKTPPLEAQQKDVRIIFKLQVVHTAKVHYSKIGMTSPQQRKASYIKCQILWEAVFKHHSYAL